MRMKSLELPAVAKIMSSTSAFPPYRYKVFVERGDLQLVDTTTQLYTPAVLLPNIN